MASEIFNRSVKKFVHDARYDARTSKKRCHDRFSSVPRAAASLAEVRGARTATGAGAGGDYKKKWKSTSSQRTDWRALNTGVQVVAGTRHGRAAKRSRTTRRGVMGPPPCQQAPGRMNANNQNGSKRARRVTRVRKRRRLVATRRTAQRHFRTRGQPREVQMDQVSGRLTEFRQRRAEPSQKQNWIEGVSSSVPGAHRPAVAGSARRTASTGGHVERRTIDVDHGGRGTIVWRRQPPVGVHRAVMPSRRYLLRSGRPHDGVHARSNGRLATPAAAKWACVRWDQGRRCNVWCPPIRFGGTPPSPELLASTHAAYLIFSGSGDLGGVEAAAATPDRQSRKSAAARRRPEASGKRCGADVASEHIGLSPDADRTGSVLQLWHFDSALRTQRVSRDGPIFRCVIHTQRAPMIFRGRRACTQTLFSRSSEKSTALSTGNSTTRHECSQAGSLVLQLGNFAAV